MNTKFKLATAALLIVLGVTCRLLPHLWNFVPVTAIALFAGFYFGRRYALVLPLVIAFVSDLFLGFYQWQLMLAVYLSFMVVGMIGFMVRKYKNVETIIAASISSSVLFYLVTNWAVWRFSPWYEKSVNGLLSSYVLAVPFFRNALLGDLFYTAVLFGSYELVHLMVSRHRRLSALVETK
ncbi:MAG: hypothetical protein HUU49_03915 [Candidatus Buchananbacteria bacterium]|nr:hypothetical protein [Candidatus Buchananbacteria bacterium]